MAILNILLIYITVVNFFICVLIQKYSFQLKSQLMFNVQNYNIAQNLHFVTIEQCTITCHSFESSSIVFKAALNN